MAQLETLAFRIAATNETEAAFQKVNRDLGNLANMTKLSGQQLAQMQFQLQDIAVGLTSGQSPFTVLMQQGSQLAQMFQSGTGVRGALQAVGQGIVSFVTNPLNLAVLGFAAAAGAASLLWNAITSGGEDANKVTERSAKLIDEVAKAYGRAQGAAEGYFAEVLRGARFDLEQQMRRQLDAVTRQLNDFAGQFRQGLFGGTSQSSLLGLVTGLDQDRALRDPLFEMLVAQVDAFRKAVAAGNGDIAAFRDQLVALGNSGASEALQKIIDRVRDMGAEAAGSQDVLDRMRAWAAYMEGTATAEQLGLIADELGRTGSAAAGAIPALNGFGAALQSIVAQVPGFAGRNAISGVIGQATVAVRNLIQAAENPGGIGLREIGRFLTQDLGKAMFGPQPAPGMPVPGRNPARDLTSDYGVAEAHAAAAKAARDAAAAERELERARESLARQADSLIDKLFPEEAAKRKLEELTAQLAKFGDALDPLQRQAIQIQIEVLANGQTLEDYIKRMRSPADQLRDAFKELKKDAQDFASTLIDGLMRGESLIGTLNTAVGNLAKRLADRALTNLFSGNLIGAAISGIGALIAGIFGRLTQKLKEVQDLRDSIDRRLNEASGRGYVNSVQDLVTQHNKDRQTALFSRDPTLIEKEMAAFQGGVRSFLEGANLTADQLADLASAFPDLADVIAEFRKKAIDEAVADIRRRINDARGLGFLNTIGDLFKQFNEDVAKTDNPALAMTALLDGVRGILNGADLTLGELEKLRKAFPILGNIINEFRRKAIAGLADDLTRRLNDVSGKGYLNQASDLLGQYRTDVANGRAAGRADLVNRARDVYIASLQQLIDQNNLTGDAFAELTRMFPSFSSQLHEATGAVDDFRKSISDYLDSLKTGDLSTLNPAEKLAAAGDQFNALLAAAQGGDQAARDRLTQGADTYLRQAQDYFASSEGYARIYDTVTAALRSITGLAAGGLVPIAGYAAGGMVGNGLWGRDSVLARYAGGGSIALAGGEFVVNAAAARANLRTLNAINRGSGNDNADIRELVADMKRLIRLTAESGSGQMQTVRQGLAEVRAAMDRLNETTRTEAGREARLRRQPGR